MNLQKETKIAVKKLLSKGSTNAKLAKNEKFGYKDSYILYLSPYRQNGQGVNVCPHASPECIIACLNTSGHGAFNSVQEARRRKTDYLLTDRINFLNQLWNELQAINKKGIKSFVKIPVRLNGTSDLDWFNLFKIIGKDLNTFEGIQFYDYTKVFTRLQKYANTNYHLTFSRSEENEEKAIEALKNGFNVAAVFRKQLPDTWNGFKVIDGDLSDLRFLDEKNTVVGLIAKGKGRKSKSGFIID